MSSTKVFIKARYKAENLGNRWSNSTTEIILSPDNPPVKGLWNTTRGSDIDSTGGSDNAIFELNKVSQVLALKTEKPGSPNVAKTPVILHGFSDFKVGVKGAGVFNFRKNDVPITWEIVKTQ